MAIRRAICVYVTTPTVSSIRIDEDCILEYLSCNLTGVHVSTDPNIPVVITPCYNAIYLGEAAWNVPVNYPIRAGETIFLTAAASGWFQLYFKPVPPQPVEPE